MFSMFRRAAAACLGILACATQVWPHGAAIDVLVGATGQLAPYLFESGLPLGDPAELVYVPFSNRILTDTPGLGVVNAANGLDAKTLLEINVTSPLIFWNGDRIVPTSSTLTVASPDGIGEYVVTGNSNFQTGMKWGVYPGGTFWEEHGFYFLEAADSPTGLYGVWVELQSPAYATSDPFLLPFIYDPQQQLDRAAIDGGIASLLTHDWITVRGDFDLDGRLDADDIDLLTGEVRRASHAEAYDLNNDSMVNSEDRYLWVEQLAFTYFGDANLDGVFNTTDLINVLQQGEYEDGVVGNSTWSSGDWNGDLEFDTGDLVEAFRAAGYEQGPRHAVANVPEPLSLTSIPCLAITFAAICQRRWASRKSAKVESSKLRSPDKPHGR